MMKTREELEKVLEVAINEDLWARYLWFSSLLNCLTATETCLIALPEYLIDENIRGKVLAKICEDIECNGFQECHERLLSEYIEGYEDLSVSAKRATGVCLRILYPYCDEKWSHRIERFLCFTPLLKRTGMKLIRENWHSDLEPLLEELWSSKKDCSLALIALNNASEAFILKNLNAIEDCFEEDLAIIGRLYIIAGKHNPNILSCLKARDEITYCHVLGKLGRKLSTKEAEEMFENNKNDERIGIMISAFGRMGLWVLLNSLLKRADELRTIEEGRFDCDTFD